MDKQPILKTLEPGDQVAALLIFNRGKKQYKTAIDPVIAKPTEFCEMIADLIRQLALLTGQTSGAISADIMLDLTKENGFIEQSQVDREDNG